MQLTTSKQACTFIVLYGFGGKTWNGYLKSEGVHKIKYSWKNGFGFDTYEDFRKDLAKAVDSYQDLHRHEWQSLGKSAAIVAYTSSLQESAEKYLERFGFVPAIRETSPRYGTPTTCWYMPTKDFMNELDIEDEEDEVDE